ncbi:TetR family transcriptional regulator [Saccharopolyspora spinosa]|uniref:TetR family transcriptional regulator n=1 Tax=Saccharopolyspora spinosa TaxID=60894 RepID=UPI000237AE30|nr:TetR family transcriptional regulator [Saccharopolyspora spinosa]
MRAELAAAAMDYVAEVGFDHATAEQIAQGIGVSRATFFRYFGSKEDALVSAARVVPMSVTDCFRAVDAEAGSTAWSTLRRAFAPLAEAVDANPAVLRRRRHLIAEAAPLRARLVSMNVKEWTELADALGERISDPFAARAVAAAAGAALELAWHAWLRDESAEFAHELDRAFEAMSTAFSITLG